jgi:hypothetical protein
MLKLKKVLKVGTLLICISVIVINIVALFIYKEIEWVSVLIINIVSIIGIIYSIKNFKK